MEKRTRITLAFLLLFAVLCLQPALGVASGRPTGSSLQFGVGSSFTPTNFGGATICYQRFLSEDFAWRLGATLELKYDELEYTADGAGHYSGWGSDALEEWNHSVSLRCEWLVYRGSDVSMYFGGGPHISYNTSQYTCTDFYFSDDDARRNVRIRNRSYGLGVTGVVGLQWAPAEWCALHVEYRAVAAYVTDMRTRHEEVVGGSNEYGIWENETTSGPKFESEGARAGMSIYF